MADPAAEAVKCCVTGGTHKLVPLGGFSLHAEVVMGTDDLWLFQALISVTPDEETYDEEDSAFCLEMLLRIVLENR